MENKTISNQAVGVNHDSYEKAIKMQARQWCIDKAIQSNDCKNREDVITVAKTYLDFINE